LEQERTNNSQPSSIPILAAEDVKWLQILDKKSAQQISNERERFLEIARQVSATIGTEFFSMLVRELRRALGAECVYVCEFMGRQAEWARMLERPAGNATGGRRSSFRWQVA
jgi:hypothetical protein